MSEIQVYQGLTPSDITTLAQAGVIPSDTPAPIVRVFAEMARQHGLSPFKKEIYLVRYGNQYSNIVGIDGLRVKACRTGSFAGKDDAKYDLQPDGTYKTAAQLSAAKTLPVSCTVTVYAAIGGFRCPFTKTVLFAEYAPANRTNKWATMPFNMIEKCAEAAALRTAFATETAGLHIEEESAAIQDITIQAAEKRGETIYVMPETIKDLYYEIESALAGSSSFEQVIATYQQQDPNGEAMQYKPFVKMFFDAACAKAKTAQHTVEFFNATPKKWQGDQDLRQQLATANKKLKDGASV